MRLAMASLLVALAGCASAPCPAAGEGAIPSGLCARGDTFAFGQRFEGGAVDLTLEWHNAKPVAAMWRDADSQLEKGALELVVRDAEGDPVYYQAGSVLGGEGTYRTQPGTPGRWTFQLRGEDIQGPFGFYAEAQATT